MKSSALASSIAFVIPVRSVRYWDSTGLIRGRTRHSNSSVILSVSGIELHRADLDDPSVCSPGRVQREAIEPAQAVNSRSKTTT